MFTTTGLAIFLIISSFATDSMAADWDYVDIASTAIVILGSLEWQPFGGSERDSRLQYKHGRIKSWSQVGFIHG